MAVLALAEAFVRGSEAESLGAAPQLAAALAKAAASAGKENSSARETLQAAQQCFKAAQQRLAQAQGDGDDRRSLAQLVAVGRASLAAVAALTPAGNTQQLAGLRYNFARRLVSCKAFADAQTEAWLLFQQLGKQAAAAGGGSRRAAASAAAADEAANMMVGTALTLVLCCVEGKLFDDAQAMQGLLQAADILPTWLSELKREEAARHGEAAHKYLYKAAVMLLERQAWQPLAGVCSSLLAASGDDATAQQRAVQAVGKLAGHMPEEAAATALAALAARTGSLALGSGAALGLLGLLCSAVQHASSTAACQQLQQAALSCTATAAAEGGSQQLLQTAALLLPALVVQAPGSGAGAADWLEPVASVVQVVTSAIEQLEGQLAAARPQPLGSQQVQVALLEAAFLPANALRRVLAAHLAAGDKAKGASGSSPGVGQLLGGAAAVAAAASTLELLCGMVWLSSRQDSLDGSQDHAAAVGLVTAARLRAACLSSRGDPAELVSSRAVRWLLGWDLQAYCAGSAGLPPAVCAVEPQELSWLASALFNVGVDLHGSQQYAAGASAMHAALAAAAVGLRRLAGGAADQDAPAWLADFCRKVCALADAQQRASDAQRALSSLAHCTALLLQLGFASPSAWQPLVQAFVRVQADQPASDEQQQHAAPAAVPPSRRGRAAASKKSATAAAPDASSLSQPAASNLLLVEGLLLREAELPRGSIAAVVEVELHCWAAAQADGMGAAGCRHTVQRLLQAVFPAEQRPVEHAAALLALHQLGMPAEDGRVGSWLLERAVQAVNKVPGAPAAAVLARARCLLAVDSARQLAAQALLEQQQERQRTHVAASTSAAGSREQDAAAVVQLAGGQPDGPAWRRVEQQAQQTLEALQAAGEGASDDQTRAAFQELSYLLSLHGSQGAAGKLHQLLPGVQPVDELLAGCLFPAAAAGTAADLQRQAEAAALEGGRCSGAAVRRAVLHCQAAEAFGAAGDMVPSLYHASEGHRLLATLFHEDSAPAGCSPPSSDAPPLGWWRLAAAYLGSLLQLGQLFEAAGLADEALHALREGQRLAAASGARPVAAVFAARLADMLCKLGQPEAAEHAASAAEQGLAGMAIAPSLPLDYCRATVQLVRAQLDIASGSGGGGISKAALLRCQAAVSSCEELACAAAVAAGGSKHHPALGWCNALRSAALLTAAEAALQQDGTAAALEHATAAAAASADGGCMCSAVRYQQAAALLFVGQHSAPQAEAEQQPAVWGLGRDCCAAADEVPVAPKGRSREAPAKPAAGRGRSKAAAPAGDAGTSDAAASRSATASRAVPQHQQRLWQALELSKSLPCMHRSAAVLLAEACGKAGHLHLAAWLLHSSLGSAMRLQYQLVLHSRRQQLLQRQRRGAGTADLSAQAEELERLESDVLQPELDWQLVLQLAGCSTAAAARQQPAPAPAGRGRKAAPAPAADASASDAGAALAALDQQARQQLLAWQAVLPAGTVACSISVLSGSGGGSLLISRLAPAGSGTAGDCLPPLLVALPVQQLSASLSQHPIRALRMDDEPGAGSAAVSSVQSVVEEMAAVLQESGRSMREMSTETREQQREWWRARLSLDDRLAALVKHLDSSWLGPWRSLLLGDSSDGDAAAGAGQAAAQHLLVLLEAQGQPASRQQAGVLRHAAAVLARHAGSGGMTPGERRQAAHQLCHAAGLACGQEQQQELAALLAAPGPRPASPAAAADQAGDADVPDAGPPPPAAAGKARRAAGRSVKFADQLDPAAEQQEEAAAVEPEPTPAPARDGRARTPAAARGRRGAAAAAEEPAEGGGGDASPVATLAAAGSGVADAEEPPQTVARGGLCRVFDGLSLDDQPAAPSTAAAAAAAGTATTARSGKHRSRLRMMQAATPGPGTARKPRAVAGAAAAAATAPRPARELPLTAAKTAPPHAARPGESAGTAAAAAGPVLLVLDGALQALPWESAAGLLHQRMYRMPSLACAAASARRADTSVDLGSTFYALNPSGDLEATQAAFQHWFAGMRGWEGKAGCAPSAAELAAALQSRRFFLYCGHGGGEQYISAAKLRSLERCSAALLMGCSSGRLRAQQHYEPIGAVLAYLLAGCPAAVANLWDVTDKDIDRFSQALLTAWISGASGGSGGGSSGGDSGVDSGSSSDGNSGSDMCAAVAASRAACKLPHLVGAAPVCYGIPSRLFFEAPA